MVRQNNLENPVNILIAHPNGEGIFRKLASLGPFLKVTFHPTNNQYEIPVDVWRSCEVLYTERTLPEPILAPNLKWIQFHYAGIDFAINAPILKKRGLKVTTLSGVPSLPMGEYALLMILSFGHRFRELSGYQERCTWPENRFEVLAPKELRNSTVGIIGYGSAGRQIARLVKAFGGTVLAVKRNATKLKDTGYYPKGTGDPDGIFVDRIYPISEIYEMLSNCDFVVVSVPLTANTKNLISVDEFTAMKRGSYLIDISRGGVVDHKALLAALQKGHLAGAALDVFPVEPLPEDHAIWKYPNVIITPHLSGYSPHYWDEATVLFQENIHRYMTGQPLLNRFDPCRGY